MVPVQLVLYSLPAVIFAIVGLRRRAREDVFKDLGWRHAAPRYYICALVLAALSAAVGLAIIHFLIPASLLSDPNVNVSQYMGLEAGLLTFLYAFAREGFYVALGEEVLFRGLLGGWFIRKFGFAVGNTLQALAFLVPHTVLLLISVAMWPLLIVQFVMGWLLGWLRHASGSILPGWLTHSLVNAATAIALTTV